jgi:uncharacterized protein (TIGR02302 family)
MIQNAPGDRDQKAAGISTALRRRIAAKIRAMQGVLFVERLWPRLLPGLCVAALFIAFSWFGFFRLVPDWLRIIALGLFAVAFVGSFFTFHKLRWPAKPEALQRLEKENRIIHQALAVQSDRLEQGDAFARSLWRRHQARMAAEVEAIRMAAPRPPTPRLDPYGLRVFVALLLVTAFGYSYSNQSGLIGDAFKSHAQQAEIAGMRVDAWVTPPDYTGKAPIFLTGNTTGLPDIIAIPQGSEMLVRIVGGTGMEEVLFRTPQADIQVPPADEAGTAVAEARGLDPRSFRIDPTNDGSLVIRQGDEIAESWRFELIPDEPPVIAFEGRPGRAVNGALEITFTVNDDYGAERAYAEILPVTPPSPYANSLYDLPEYPLTLPRSGARERKGRESRNLTEHPMAGLPVHITLVAEDSMGQIGRSETIEMLLPGKFFHNLLAGAVAEQRQVLALDTNRVDRVIDLNDAITFAPEETIKNSTHYLLIRSARTRIRQSYSDDMYRDSADYLWDIALGIEDGDLSFAERRLREAQRALSEALENDASDETIQALMDELREAMQEFLQALAQNMQQNQQTAQIPPEALQNMLRSEDLNRMMDQIENLAKSGAKDQAQQLLSELQRMMNNLQTGQHRQVQGDNPMRQQLDKLGELMQRQQQLMNETFNLEQALREQRRQQYFQNEDRKQGENQPGQEQQQNQQPGSDGELTEEQLRQALRDLKEQQEALQKQLGEMQQSLESLGMPPNDGFNEAGEAMGEAGKALGEGEGETAVGEQGRALQALRQGAQDMMNQMRQAMGQSPGPNPGSQSRDRSRLDPLGRPRANTGPDFGENVKIPEEADIQRARRILEAIRERLGDAFRPEMERFYLERLLDSR